MLSHHSVGQNNTRFICDVSVLGHLNVWTWFMLRFLFCSCLGILGNSTIKHECKTVWRARNSQGMHMRKSDLIRLSSHLIIDIYIMQIRYLLDRLIFRMWIAMNMKYNIPQIWEQFWYILFWGSYNTCCLGMKLQWNLSVTATSIMRFITCDLFSNVF